MGTYHTQLRSILAVVMQQKNERKLPHFHKGLIQAPRFPDLSQVQIPVPDLKAEIDINWHLEKIKKMGSEKSFQPNMDSFTSSYRESQQSDFDLESTLKRPDDEVGIQTFDQEDEVDEMSEFSF